MRTGSCCFGECANQELSRREKEKLMTTEFETLNLQPQLMQAIAKLGYEEPSEVQSNVIPLMLDGKDVIAQSQTGSGKTAAFAMPILQDLIFGGSTGEIQALVLTPTRELAIQVAEAIHDYGQFIHVKVMAVYGGQHYGASKRKIAEGLDVLVGTPGRLQDLMRQSIVNLNSVRTVILDEADEMLSMGFIEDIENILGETPQERQTTLFSATIPAPIRRIAEHYMHDPVTVTVDRKQLTVASIDQRYYLVNKEDKLAVITRLLESEAVGSTLVFTKTRAGSGTLANELTQRGYPSEALNGDLEQTARLRVLDRFRSGQLKILVATDVAVRGLDIDDISHVFNYDVPNDPEAYVHRIGRTGRAGKEGVAITLITPNEMRYLHRIEGYAKNKVKRAEIPSEEEINARRENHLLNKVRVWLERDRCKREEEMIAEFVAEGHDLAKIAAAALKLARVEEKRRPIETIGEVNLNSRSGKRSRRPESKSNGNGKNARKRTQHGGNGNRNVRRAQEDGMVRLKLARGKVHGINPGEVVGGIASRAAIPGNAIGKIIIEEHNTLVDVHEECVSRVLGQTGCYHFRDHHNVTIERAA